MTEKISAQPPLDVEQALDLILAAAAHRSSNARHSEFGRLVIDEYFQRLRERYKNDAIALRYLDNLLAAVAAAIRAFSVERDKFSTRWGSLQSKKQHELELAHKIADYAPLTGSIRGHILTLLTALGLTGPLLTAWSNLIHPLSVAALTAFFTGIIVALIVLQISIELYRTRHLKKIEEKYPIELVDDWETRSLKQYRQILKRFLLIAIRIREEQYPERTTLQGERLYEKYDIPHIDILGEDADKPKEALPEKVDRLLDSIIETHFAYKVKREGYV